MPVHKADMVETLVKTGASCRSQMIMVSPLGSVLVVMRCSKLLRSWPRTGAIANTAAEQRKIAKNREKGLCCIQPPKIGERKTQ